MLYLHFGKDGQAVILSLLGCFSCEVAHSFIEYILNEFINRASPIRHHEGNITGNSTLSTQRQKGHLQGNSQHGGQIKFNQMNRNTFEVFIGITAMVLYEPASGQGIYLVEAGGDGVREGPLRK